MTHLPVLVDQGVVSVLGCQEMGSSWVFILFNNLIFICYNLFKMKIFTKCLTRYLYNIFLILHPLGFLKDPSNSDLQCNQF